MLYKTKKKFSVFCLNSSEKGVACNFTPFPLFYCCVCSCFYVQQHIQNGRTSSLINMQCNLAVRIINNKTCITRQIVVLVLHSETQHIHCRQPTEMISTTKRGLFLVKSCPFYSSKYLNLKRKNMTGQEERVQPTGTTQPCC